VEGDERPRTVWAGGGGGRQLVRDFLSGPSGGGAGSGSTVLFGRRTGSGKEPFLRAAVTGIGSRGRAWDRDGPWVSGIGSGEGGDSQRGSMACLVGIRAECAVKAGPWVGSMVREMTGGTPGTDGWGRGGLGGRRCL